MDDLDDLDRPIAGHRAWAEYVTRWYPTQHSTMRKYGCYGLLRRVRAARRPSFSFPTISFTWHHLSLMVRSPRFAWQRTNIWCPRDRALLKSRTAFLPGGSVAQPKLTEGRKNHARSPQRTAFLFLTISVVVSPRSALCSNAASAATMPRRLRSRR
jgi:hypothetical protein